MTARDYVAVCDRIYHIYRTEFLFYAAYPEISPMARQSYLLTDVAESTLRDARLDYDGLCREFQIINRRNHHEPLDRPWP